MDESSLHFYDCPIFLTKSSSKIKIFEQHEYERSNRRYNESANNLLNKQDVYLPKYVLSKPSTMTVTAGMTRVGEFGVSNKKSIGEEEKLQRFGQL